MINKKLKNKKGVTLIELMIYVAILGLICLVLAVFLKQGIDYYRLITAKTEIQRNARHSIDLINRTLRQAQAKSVSISNFDPNQPPCSLIGFTHINGRAYQFYQNNNKLFMNINGVVTMVADNLRVAYFYYPHTDDNKIISVSLTFEQATRVGESKKLQLSVVKIRIMN